VVVLQVFYAYNPLFTHHIVMYKPNAHQARHLSEEQSSSPAASFDEDKKFLLHSGRGFKNPNTAVRWMNWRVAALVFNTFLFIGGLSIWVHVLLLLKSLRCDTTPEIDHFEPDCKRV
jgi:hypothetical protein